MPDTKHRVRLFKRDRKLNLCYIFSCNDTCNLDVVETLLSGLKEKFGIGILAFKSQLSLLHSSEMCESIIPDLPMDFAIFVVHANEDRLSFNEDIDGIGYAKVYRALLKATSDRVIVVMTGDNNYKNSDEEQSVVLSRWGWGKISSQFNVECLDGRKSFIFSWDKEHRPIHEEAMMHFLDPEKKGERFVPKPRVEPTVVVKSPKKADEYLKTDVKATKTKQNSSDIQTETSLAQKTQTRRKQESVSVPSPKEQHQNEEDMDVLDEHCVDVLHDDIPKAASLPDNQAVDTSASSVQESIAILYRDQTDIAAIKDMFGDGLPGTSPVRSNDPSKLKALLLKQSVRSCFIIVEAIKMREELHKKSCSTSYQDLLKAAYSTVEKKVVVILCNNRSDISPSEEDTITAVIEGLLSEKGFILWWKRKKIRPQTKRSFFSRSHSFPDGSDDTGKNSAKKGTPAQVTRPKNPEILILQTRLRHGMISYDKNDVKVILQGWTPPEKMADDLFKKFQSIANAELLVYRETETGNERTVVKEDSKSQLSAAWNVVSSTISYYIPSNYSLGESSNTPPSNNDTPSSNKNTPFSNNDSPPSNNESPPSNNAPSSNDKTHDPQLD